MAAKPSPPQPPRLSGDQAADFQSLRHWHGALYQNAVKDTKLLDPAYQYDGGTFDPDNLFDPAESSIGMAQNTANEAYTKAAQGTDDAAGAQSTADTALANAATANTNALIGITDAASATAAAIAAQTTANTGVTNAAAAQATAANAVTDAAAAQTAADAAQVAADAAQTTANTGVTNAAAAQATADSAYAVRAFAYKTASVIGAATTGVTSSFTDPTGDNYTAMVTIRSVVNTPAAGSNRILLVTRTPGGGGTATVTVTVEVAPGLGNTVTFDVLMFPQF